MSIDLPEIGVFSPYTLMLHSQVTGENSAQFIKRALILFEKLLIIPTGISIGKNDAILTKEKYLFFIDRYSPFCSSKEFHDLFLLDSDLFEDTDKIYEKIWNNEDDDLWSGTHGDTFVDFVSNYVENVAGKDASISEQWGMKKMFIGNISHDIKTLSWVMKTSNKLSGLFSDIHEQAIRATIGSRAPFYNKIVQTTGEINYFDFSQLTWENIMELRKSEFLKIFRNKIIEWTNEYSKEEKPEKYSANLKIFIEDAKFKFIDINSPQTRQSILTGICGNLPSPIIINPISLLSSISDAKKAITLKKDYGWLVFIQRAYSKLKDGT